MVNYKLSFAGVDDKCTKVYFTENTNIRIQR